MYAKATDDRDQCRVFDRCTLSHIVIMAIDLRWCTVDDLGRRISGWARSAALATDGTVFVPAAIVGEADAVLSAGFDGVTIVRYRNHAFVPATWLRTEYPKAADLILKIERGVREHFA